MLNLRTMALLFVANALLAQQTVGTLRGVLTDNSGGVIPAASVSLMSGSAQKVATTQSDGSYSFVGLAPGPYTLRVVFPGFAPFEKAVTISNGQTLQVPVQLAVTGGKQEVSVNSEGDSTVSVDPDRNATAIVIKGSDLDALPDDPDDLNDMLQALAGPAAGPNGGQLSVDGFSGAQLPPKSTIREIRVNQNPFSAEYDRLGMGRIDILTKPGSEKFRGGLGVYASDGVFNSRNPYAANKADYSTRQFEGNLSGPLGHRASFFLNFGQRTINSDALINAVTLDPTTLAPTPVRSSVVTPSHNYNIGPRIDYQLSTNHTLTGRYSYSSGANENNGIGQYSLISRAYNSERSGQELQLTETAILNTKTVNETRFGFGRSRNNQYGDNSIPAINVSEAFSAGGAQVGRQSSVSQRFDLQNNTSIGRGVHTFRFGLRARHTSLSDDSPANFGGSFTFFGVGNAPVLDATNQAVTDGRGQNVVAPIGSLEQYRRTLLFQRLGYSAAQIRALGGGASQFSVAGGNPLVEVSQTDLGLFAQDDWRMKPNLTLSLGLRYETQTNIHDWRDFAPRVGLAWSPKAKNGKPPKTVIRTGVGAYYDRVGQNLTMQQLRFNGINQQQFLVTSPDFFPNVPALATLAAQKQPVNTYRIDQKLRAPIQIQSAISLERQLPGKTTLSATYLNMHGTHVLRTVNINTPLPGTYNPSQAGSGVRPYGDASGNLFLYESDGIINQNMFVINASTRFSPKVSLNVYYDFLSANSDVDHMGLPSNPYNFKQDYGRAAWVRHDDGDIYGSITGPFGVQFNPNLVIAAGSPYDLTTGHDINGDTISNDRPAFATDLTRPSVAVTRFGAFDTNPIAGQKLVPRNYLTADRMWNFNLRVGRTFGFGKLKAAPSAPAGGARPAGGGERRYSINFNVSANNVFNHVNHGGFVGNLASPLFGQSTSIYLFRNDKSNNRLISFGTRFSF